MDYISRLWENISKKGKCLGFSQEKITKKGKFDGLCKQTEKIFPKKEALQILYRNKNTKNRNFDGLYNDIISYSNRSHKLALQHDYHIGILNGLLKQVT